MSTVPAADNFRTNLRVAIRAKGLTQRAIALGTGMAESYISNVIKGHVMPTVPQCERLATAVGFPLPWLFDEPEKFELAIGNGQAALVAGKK